MAAANPSKQTTGISRLDTGASPSVSAVRLSPDQLSHTLAPLAAPPGVASEAGGYVSAAAAPVQDTAAPMPVADAPALASRTDGAVTNATAIAPPASPDAGSSDSIEQTLSSPQLPSELPCRLQHSKRRLCLGRSHGALPVHKMIRLDCSLAAGAVGLVPPLEVCLYHTGAQRPVDTACGVAGLRCNVAADFAASGTIDCSTTSELDTGGAPLPMHVRPHVLDLSHVLAARFASMQAHALHC